MHTYSAGEGSCCSCALHGEREVAAPSSCVINALKKPFMSRRSTKPNWYRNVLAVWTWLLSTAFAGVVGAASLFRSSCPGSNNPSLSPGFFSG